MFDFNEPDQQSIQSQSLVRVLRNIPVTLPMFDYQKLQEHLEDCECALRPSSKLLAYVLANKLMTTRPVDDVHHSDQAVGGSCITYTVDGGSHRPACLLTAPEQACGMVSSLLHRCWGLR